MGNLESYMDMWIRGAKVVTDEYEVSEHNRFTVLRKEYKYTRK
jgi:hypothetical protein